MWQARHVAARLSALYPDCRIEILGMTTRGDKILDKFDITKWHEYHIIAKGNHLQQFIDGKQTIDVVDHDKKGRALEGILALQIHVGGPMLVQFKDLELKRLPEGGIIDP